MSRYPITLHLESSIEETEKGSKNIINVLVYESDRKHELIDSMDYVVLREADTLSFDTVVNHHVKDFINPDNCKINII